MVDSRKFETELIFIFSSSRWDEMWQGRIFGHSLLNSWHQWCWISKAFLLICCCFTAITSSVASFTASSKSPHTLCLCIRLCEHSDRTSGRDQPGRPISKESIRNNRCLAKKDYSSQLSSHMREDWPLFYLTSKEDRLLFLIKTTQLSCDFFSRFFLLVIYDALLRWLLMCWKNSL